MFSSWRHDRQIHIDKLKAAVTFHHTSIVSPKASGLCMTPHVSSQHRPCSSETSCSRLQNGSYSHIILKRYHLPYVGWQPTDLQPILRASYAFSKPSKSKLATHCLKPIPSALSKLLTSVGWQSTAYIRAASYESYAFSRPLKFILATQSVLKHLKPKTSKLSKFLTSNYRLATCVFYGHHMHSQDQ